MPNLDKLTFESAFESAIGLMPVAGQADHLSSVAGAAPAFCFLNDPVPQSTPR